MQRITRLVLMLVLLFAAGKVPLTAQQTVPLVESVRLYFQEAGTKASLVTNTMNARGEALPMTLVMEFYPAGSVNAVNLIDVWRGGVHIRQFFATAPASDLQPTTLGCALALKTAPGKEGKEEFKVQVATKDGQHVTKSLWVEYKDEHAKAISLEGIPSGSLAVGDEGKMHVKYDPENTTNKLVKFELSPVDGLQIKPTDTEGVYSFKALKECNVELKATAENGRANAAHCEKSIKIQKHYPTSIRLSMTDGENAEGEGSIDRKIYRHKTKVWRLKATLTSAGSIIRNLRDVLEWESDGKLLVNGTDAAIYGNGVEGRNEVDSAEVWRGTQKQKMWEPLLVDSVERRSDGVYTTELTYAFKADREAQVELNLKARAPKSSVKGAYRLKIENHNVDKIEISPSKLALRVGSDPKGFIVVKTFPEKAYEQRYAVELLSGGDVVRGLQADKKEANRWNFEAGTQGGRRMLEVRAIAGGCQEPVYVDVEKVLGENIVVRDEMKSREIQELKLSNGRKVRVWIGVGPDGVYDNTFRILSLNGTGKVRELRTDGGALELEPIGCEWGKPGLYEVRAIGEGQENKRGAFTIESGADRKDAAEGKKVQVSYGYTVTPNPARAIKIDSESIQFTYGAEAQGKIREGMQRVKIEVEPDTAADRRIKFTTLPNWLKVYDAYGKPIEAGKDCESGEFYVEVKTPQMVSDGHPNEGGDITVELSCNSTVRSRLGVRLTYKKVQRYIVEMPGELKRGLPTRVKIGVEPADASDPKFVMIVKSTAKTSSVGKWSTKIAVTNSEGRKVNGADDSYSGAVACEPGTYTIASSDISDDGEKLFLSLRASGGVGEGAASDAFTVRDWKVTSVSYDSHLNVPIRNEYFTHRYTALKVSVEGEDKADVKLQFKRKGEGGAPLYVNVEGPVNGYYLFTPKPNVIADAEEQLVGTVVGSSASGPTITVKVLEVKASALRVEDSQGNDITGKEHTVVFNVTESVPLRVKMTPSDVSKPVIQTQVYNPWPGKFGFFAGPVERVARDSVNDCLIFDLTYYTAGRASATEPIDFVYVSNTKNPSGVEHTKQSVRVTFVQKTISIEKLRVEPASVKLFGEGASADVKVTYAPDVVSESTISVTAPGGITVKPVSRIGAECTYRLTSSAQAVTSGAVQFTAAGATASCEVDVLQPVAGTAMKLTTRSAAFVDGVLELKLGEAAAETAELELSAKPDAYDEFFDRVRWTLKQGPSNLELSRYIKLEKVNYSRSSGESVWRVKLTGLNRTIQGVNNAPLELEAHLGSLKVAAPLKVRISYSKEANARLINRVSFPRLALQLAVGETKSVKLRVEPDDPSLKSLRWTYPEGAGNVSIRQGKTWDELLITGEKQGQAKISVSSADSLGMYTEPMLEVKVVARYYDLVMDVIDADNRPLENTCVVIETNTNPPVKVFEGYTAKEGRLVCRLEGGGKSYGVQASRAGYKNSTYIHSSRGHANVVTINDQPVHHLLLLVRDLVRPLLSGVFFEVTDEGGKPLPGAEVRFADFGIKTCDAEGMAKFYDVPNGNYYATVRCEGYSETSVAVQHDGKGGPVKVVLTKLAIPPLAKHSIALRVVDEVTKIGVARCTVTVDGRSALTTDIDGNVAVEGLVDGTYGIVVEGPTDRWTAPLLPASYYFESQTLQVQLKGTDEKRMVALVRKANPPAPVVTRTLTVTVLDGGFGSLLSGVEVRLAGGDAKRTDANGRVIFEKLVDSPSARTVEVSGPGYGSQKREVVVAGENAKETFVLKTLTYTVALTVRGKGGAPLKDAVVYFDNSRRETTGNDGVATFEGIPYGAHMLTATADGYRNGDLRLAIEKDIKVDLQLEKGFSPALSMRMLTVAVTSGGGALAEATVRLSSGAEQTTNTKGEAQFEVLDGVYEVTASRVGYEAKTATARVSGKDERLTISVPQSTAAEVLRGVTITVVDNVSNVPLLDARVEIEGINAISKTPTAWVCSLPAGEYSCIARCKGYVTQVADIVVGKSNVNQEFKLVRGAAKKYPLAVSVCSVAGDAIEGATVAIEGIPADRVERNVTTFLLEPDIYTVKVSKEGFVSAQAVATVANLPANRLTVTLKRVFKVTFNANGGKLASGKEKEEVAVEEGSRVPQPANPTRDGYEFMRWDRGSDGYNFEETVNANVELVAQWKGKSGAVATYVVTFNANGGKLASGNEREEVAVEEGSKVPQPANPTRDGYEFVRWDRGSDGYNFEEAVYSNFELVAQWRSKTGAASTYVVTFNANGGRLASGKEKEEVAVAEGSKVPRPANPTRDGYEFVRWDRGSDGYNFEEAVNANFELVAQWKAKEKTAVESVLLAAVQICPNPVSELLEVSAEAVIARYELVDINGTSVLAGGTVENKLHLDVAHLPEGLYILRLVDTVGGVTTRRVVVRR